MNKTELVDAIAKKAGLKKTEAEKFVKAFTDSVTKELKKGGKVQIKGSVTPPSKVDSSISTLVGVLAELAKG